MDSRFSLKVFFISICFLSLTIPVSNIFKYFHQSKKNAEEEKALKMIGFYNKPPDCEKLQKARQLRLKQRQMKAIIKEICNHMLVVIVVLFVAYANHDTKSYAFSKEIDDIFVQGKISTYQLSMVGYIPWYITA